MPCIDYPQELSKAFWDKKKGALPAGSDTETALKALQKKHESIDWRALAPGWEKSAQTADELNAAHATLDKLYRSKVLPLKAESKPVVEAVGKLAKDKGLGKPTLEAIKDITEAAKAYSKAIDAGLDQLTETHTKTLAVLEKIASKKSNDQDDEDEKRHSVLLDPKQLLAQLQRCKRDPNRRAHFALISDGKADPVMCLSTKVPGKTLFAKLQAETGIKLGSFGTAWVADAQLMLHMTKPFAALPKRAQLALRAVGFKVSKVVLTEDDGRGA